MTLRSFFRRSQSGQRQQLAEHENTTRRPRFEMLEDRRMLSFTPAANYATIGTPSFIVTADFNNDGKLDLATLRRLELPVPCAKPRGIRVVPTWHAQRGTKLAQKARWFITPKKVINLINLREKRGFSSHK